MSSVPSPTEIARDATWLAQALDPAAGMARLVRMSEREYRDASFLDDRMLHRPIEAHVLSWTEIAAAVSGAHPEDARWIFHIGHVGSTLIARLLGELPSVLSVREPRILRDIVPEGVDRQVVRKLLSRTFGPEQIALVKATSFVSEIAPKLIGKDGRALFLTASPRNYIASILAGDNSIQELQMLAASRAERMSGRLPPLPRPRHLADLAAAAWACEMTALELAAEARPDAQICWIDFDRFLDDVGGGLHRLVDALALVADERAINALAGSPLLQRYSKALEYDYSPALRRELIAEASAAAGAEIGEAIAMLDAAAQGSPLLARALGRFEED